jgi:hypothetical protein
MITEAMLSSEFEIKYLDGQKCDLSVCILEETL